MAALGSDEQELLVLQAVGGDTGARERLFTRYATRLVRLVMHADGLSEDEAKDVVQDTFIRAFRTLKKLQKVGSFERWLITIARNRAATYQRRKTFRGWLSDQLGREPDPEPDAIVPLSAQKEREAQLVRQLIAEYPDEKIRLTVQGFYVEGLSVRDIAEHQGVPISTVTTRLNRFRDRIKEELLKRLLGLGEG